MDYSVNVARNVSVADSHRDHLSIRNLNASQGIPFTDTSNIPTAPMENMIGNLLSTITGSSVAFADDTPSPDALPSNATSRYTGNTCNHDGLIKSVAEGGLIAGAAGTATGAVGAITGAEMGAPGGLLGIAGGAVVGAALGMIGGTVSGGVAHELGCN